MGYVYFKFVFLLIKFLYVAYCVSICI
uniref:Uncharacterized protein n=1 Tax=Ciona intestinalis TaxID=7719 RepID=H2XXR2_CIOIN